MPVSLARRFEKIGSQEKRKDPLVIAKYFCGRYTWLATEYNPELREFFGYVIGDFSEFGYFSLDELLSINSGLIIIERDCYFTEAPLSVFLERYGDRKAL